MKLNPLSLASLLLLPGLISAAQPNPIPGSEDISVRDPAIWYNWWTKQYYIFSTREGIKIFKAPRLTGPWTRSGSVMPNCSVIDLPGNCNCWAPDVNFINGSYTLYYSVSTIGSQTSAIGVATSPSMEPGTWKDHGAVITSQPGDLWNAIDPNLIFHNGLWRLSYGSYWNGMYQIGLWPDIKTKAPLIPPEHLAGGKGRAAEGVFIYKPMWSIYYYCFFSGGITPLEGSEGPEAGNEYKVLVGRGLSASGPFKDKNGKILTEDTKPEPGTIVLGSHDNIYAPGGQSVFLDPVSQREVMVYHYVRNNDRGGASYLGINYLSFASGWPVVVE